MPCLVRGNVLVVILLLIAAEARALDNANQGPEPGGFALQETRKTAVKAEERGPTPCVQSQRDLLKQVEGRKGANPTAIYLPQCDMRDESLYQRLQCHSKVGVCWCVDIITGDPVTDECEGSTAVVELHNVDKFTPSSQAKKRDIKRCTKPEKITKFYKKLFSTFQEEYAASQANAQLIEPASTSLKDSKQRVKIQQAVLWKFKSLDKNGNEILERSEWRGYRKSIRMWQGVRTCARNFFRFCDADLNRKITQEEWRDCTIPNIDLALVEKAPPINPFTNHLLIEDRGLNK